MSGEPRTLHTNCPSCGGTVSRGEGSRAERCPYCGHRSLLWDDGERDLRFSLSPLVDAEAARDGARFQLLDRRLLSERAMEEVTFEEPRLSFVPYLWYSTTRTGLMERSRNVGVNAAKTIDTKVVIDDFEAFRLAVELPGWGLFGLDIDAMLNRDDAPMSLPFDGAELRRQGVVLAPTQGFDDIKSWAINSVSPQDIHGLDGASTEPVNERRRILFVPIWNLAYSIGGRRYEAHLEAVSGVILSARAPEDKRWKVPMALFTAGLPSFVLGKSVVAAMEVVRAGLGIAFINPGALLTGLLMVLGAGFFFAAFLSFAWSLLRYEADLVFERGALWSEQLERPFETGLERLTSRLAGALMAKVLGAGSPEGDQ